MTSSPVILTSPFSLKDRQGLEKAFREGLVMAYPTETAYALGGNALDSSLTEKIYRLKNRSEAKALPLLIDGSSGLKEYAGEVSPPVEILLKAFWPGALTLIFRALPSLPSHLKGKNDRHQYETVALRWSSNKTVDDLLKICGAPLIGTSANISGSQPANSLDDIRSIFGGELALVVDGGVIPPGKSSTLLDTTTRPFRILREGAIPTASIRGALQDFPAWSPEGQQA